MSPLPPPPTSALLYERRLAFGLRRGRGRRGEREILDFHAFLALLTGFGGFSGQEAWRIGASFGGWGICIEDRHQRCPGFFPFFWDLGFFYRRYTHTHGFAKGTMTVGRENDNVMVV